MPSVDVPISMPFCSVWTDQLVKRRLSNEITMFGGYGKIDVRQLNAYQYSMVNLISNISYINFSVNVDILQIQLRQIQIGQEVPPPFDEAVHEPDHAPPFATTNEHAQTNPEFSRQFDDSTIVRI